MKKLKVRVENSPCRCEICHQTDFFDPINNYCSRCTDISKTTQLYSDYANRPFEKHTQKTDIHTVQIRKQKQKQLNKLVLLNCFISASTVITLFLTFILTMYLLPIEVGKIFYSEGVIKIILRVYIDIVTALVGSLLQILGIGVLEGTAYLLPIFFCISCYLWRKIKNSKEEIIQ